MLSFLPHLGSSIWWKKLNSITRYPSIPTYHQFNRNGKILEDRRIAFTDSVSIQEKINGVQARAIFFGNGEIVYGTKKKLFYCSSSTKTGFLIPYGSLSKDMHQVYSALSAYFNTGTKFSIETGLIVLYFEVYGGHLPFNELYTSSHKVDLRAIDNFQTTDESLFDKSLPEIVRWRNLGGQKFEAAYLTPKFNVGTGSISPVRRFSIPLTRLPKRLFDCGLFLKQYAAKSEVRIDSIEPKSFSMPEGLILRSEHQITTETGAKIVVRKEIAQMNWEDYAHAFALEKQNATTKKSTTGIFST